MNKIDTSNWKEFPLEALFKITGSQTTPKKDLIFDDSSLYPYVTTAGTNNGVCGYSDNYTEKGDILTIDSAVLGTCFYQEKNFTASDHVEKLIPNFEINKRIALFLATILNANSKVYGYAYNEKRSQNALKNETIKLPVDATGNPDFLYMETYIKNLESKVSSSLTNLKSAKKFAHSSKVDVKKWKRFHLYDECLFDIDSGTKLDKVKMHTNNPTVNFVGRANANNGITTCVDLIEDIKPYEAGNMTLSLGGEYLGSCFVQKEPFYTSQNVVVLIPKWNMPFEVKMFISCMVFKESRTYYKAFIDELNRHIKRDFSFYLPIKNDENPDWDYMEQYIKSIQSKVSSNALFNNTV